MPYVPGAGATTTGANPFANSTLPANAQVYVGTQKHVATSDSQVQAQEAGRTFPDEAKTLNAGDLFTLPFQYKPGSADMLKFQQSLIDGHYLSKTQKSGIYDDNTQSAYQLLLQDAAGYTAAGQTITPDELLSLRKSAVSSGTTSTRKDVSLTDPITAGAYVDKTITAATGRGATAQDRANFTAALNAYQNANPTTTTTSTDTAGNSTTVSNSANVDPSAYADAYARSGALGTEGNTHMIATDYYKAALGVLGAGGHGG